jgi:hypothetical protein
MTQLLSLDKLAGTPDEGNLFPINWRFSFVQGVNNTGRICIPLDQILFENKFNTVRAGGRDASLVAELQNSFASGVDTTQYLPIIEKLPVPIVDGNSVKYYVLRDGYNRFETLLLLGVKYYWFDVVEFGDDKRSASGARGDLTLLCNRHHPSRSSTDRDIHLCVSHLVNDNDLENDFLTIKKYIMRYAGATAGRAHRLADVIAKDNGITVPVVTWSSIKLKQGVTKRFGVESHGNYDRTRNMFGWTVLEGYEADTISNAIAKYSLESSDTSLNEGKSYIVGHTKLVDSVEELNEKRENIVSTINKKLEDLIAICEYYNKTGKLPFELIGFLPQSSDECTDNKIIPVSAIKPTPSVSKKNGLPLETDGHIVRSGLNKALNIGTKRKLTITKVAKKK